MALLSMRQRRIVQLVASSIEPLTGQQLANELGCSVRTVQAEIMRINGGEPVLASSNRGYRIVKAGLEAVRNQLENVGEVAEPLEHSILKSLLLDRMRMTVDDLSLQLNRSASVIERHLAGARAVLEVNGLELARESGALVVHGSEDSRRILLGQLISCEAKSTFMSKSGRSAELDEMDYSFVCDIAARAIHLEGRYVEPGYESGLYINMAIALFRLRSDAHGQSWTCEGSGMDAEERIACSILTSYVERWSIAPRAGDVAYLAALLRGSTRPKGIEVGYRIADEMDPEFVCTIGNLVDEALKPFLICVKDDERLSTFALHIHDLITRAEAGQAADSGLLETIQQTYPFVYEASQLVCTSIEDSFGIRIMPEERGFICLHLGVFIGAAEQRKPLVAVVADAYQGIATKLRNRLIARFGDEATFLLIDERMIEEDVAFDLVVSTRMLPGIIRTVLVSPFIRDEDLVEVERGLLACHDAHSETLRSQLDAYFDETLFFCADSTGCVDGVPVRTRNEALSFLAGKLQDAGIVDERFLMSVEARERAGSTCFLELFAIPHAIEMNAQRTVFCVLVSERGIMWDKVLIHVVLMIAVHADDRSNFMTLFDNVARALCDKTRVAEMARSRTLKDLTAWL